METEAYWGNSLILHPPTIEHDRLECRTEIAVLSDTS